uniref:A2M domain-containing protein n=1 Tax=Strongyloides papillosus TaxID=174720 RepID=A0A0N5BNE2_STREA
MVGTNYLIVFSTTNTKIIDMILFIGSNLCQNTNYFVSSKKTILFFNDTYQGHIKGPDNGLALMKVYDKRITFFDNSNKLKDDFWNLEKLLNLDGFFSSKNVFNPLPPEIEGDIIRNFKPINDFFDEIFEICKNFINTKTFSPQNKQLTFGNSSYWISNKCTNLIKEAIKNLIQRNKEEQDFYNDTKLSSINVVKQIFKNMPAIKNRYTTKKLSQNIYDDIIIEDDNNNYDNNIRNSEIRDFFPEVWIFDEFTLDDNGFASFNFIPPHSITTWIVDADFWKPSTTYTCPIKYNQELEYRKDFFIEINLPSTIRALETIDISVTVHSLSNSSFDNLYICMDKGTKNSCQNRGRDGSLADNSHFSLKSTTVNNVATKKFEVIFFEENNNEIISFSLRRHVEDDKTFACESNDVYDIIKKSVKILPDIRVDFKSTFFIINPDKKSELFSENELDKDKNFIITEKRDEKTSELITNITIVPGKDEIVGNLMVTLSEPRMYHMEDNNNDRRKRDILSKYGDSHIYWIMSELSSIFYKKLKKDFINEFIIKEEIPENEYLNIDYSNTLWANIIKLKKYMVECDKYDFFVDTIDNAKEIKTCTIEDVIKGDNVWITMLNTMMICDLYTSDAKQNNKDEMFFNINKLLDFLKISMKDGNLIEYILLPFDVEKDDKKYILYGIYLHVLNSCKFYDKSKNDNEINEIFSQFEDREKEDILSTLFYISSSKRGNDYKRIFAWNDILYCFNYNFKKMPWIQEKIDECEDIFRGSQRYISNPDTNMLINILALYAVTNNFSIPTNYPNVSTSELQDYTLITRNKRSDTNLANEIFLEQEIYKYIIFDMKKRNYRHKKMLDIRMECIPSCHFIPQEDYGSDGKSKVIHFPSQTKTILFKSKGNGKKVALVEGNMLTKLNVLKNEYPLKIDVKMYSEKNDLTHIVTIKNLKNQNLDMIQFEHGLYSAGYELKFNNDEGYVIFEDKDNIKYKTKPYRTDNSVVFLIGPLSTDKDTLSYNLTQKAVKAEANDIKLMGTKIILRHPIKGILGKIIVDNRTGFLKNKGDAKEKDSDVEYLCLQNSKKCFCGEGTSNDMCKIEMTDRIERSFNKDLYDKKKFLLVGEITNITTVEENEDYRKFTIVLRAQSCKTSFDVNLHVFVRTTNNSNVKCILFSKGDDVMLSGNVENTKSSHNIYHMSNGDVLVRIKENDGAAKTIVKLPFIKC